MPDGKKAAWVETGVEIRKRPERRMFIGELAEAVRFELTEGINPR